MASSFFEKHFVRLYLVCAVVFIASTLVKPYAFSWLVKLLPMAILIIYTFIKRDGRNDRLFLIGLLFSACGDFFLDYDRTNWFIFGLASFFIAHVFYLLTLWPLCKEKSRFVLFYIVYGVGIFSLIAGGLGELFVPVLFYMLVLLLMGLATLLSTKSNPWLIAGGILFIFSDSLIGIDKFYLPIAHASVWIMFTYYAAQFSLVKGLICARNKG